MALEIAFHTKALRDVCASKARAARSLGEKAGSDLAARIADLRAAPDVGQLIPDWLQQVDGHLDRYAIEIGPSHRLVFGANHAVTPMHGSGAVDWSRVTRVKILEIGTQ